MYKLHWELISYTRITCQVVYSLLNYGFLPRKELTMSHNNNHYLTVGIDVGSTFSFMTIIGPQERTVLKPFKIFHNRLDSLKRACLEIEKSEELYSLKSRISFGIYRNILLPTLLLPKRIHDKRFSSSTLLSLILSEILVLEKLKMINLIPWVLPNSVLDLILRPLLCLLNLF